MGTETLPPNLDGVQSSSPDLPSQFDGETCTPTYQTVATVPLQRDSPEQDTLRSLPANGTQPTQIPRPSSPDMPSSPPKGVVQVAASSPLAPPARKQSGILASAMAPMGTTFRRPYIPSPPPKTTHITIDSDDEGPTYKGGSSDSDMETLRKSDIKPATFVRRTQAPAAEKVEESPQAKSVSANFQEITKKAFYNPVFQPAPLAPAFTTKMTSGVKRFGDTMASAYGNVSKRPRQLGPSKAQPVVVEDRSPELEVDDIPDPNLRQKVKRMTTVFPTHKVRELMRALNVKKGNYDDAMEYLLDLNTEPVKKQVHIDLSGSDDELLMTPAQRATVKSSSSKPVVLPKKPVQSIRDKWSTQIVNRKIAPKRLDVFDTPEPAPKKKTLVRGRKHPTSPSASQESNVLVREVHTTALDSDEVDSGLQSASEDQSFNGRLLSFFNNCTAADLVDTASITAAIAEQLVSKRPFRSLLAVRRVERPETVKPENDGSKAKSKSKARPVGDSIVDKCEDMLMSYEAVDFLVEQCETMGKPLAEEIKSWGVNLTGQKDGQLDLVSLQDPRRSLHDSGIGTPVSDTDDVERGLVNRSANKFLGQPVSMADDIQMKDYQIAGLNWLALLYRRRNSCILADDMGLGKTCQVIAFLTHLLESGERGPHLIVVPSATLENWLKEFRRFSPSLKVEPYYGSQKERAEMRERADAERDDINVLVTTYVIAKAQYDFAWLRKFGFRCTVFDEGHNLKNADSQGAQRLIKIESSFRLLLTGTPLQNNLKELISLLAFLMPRMFKEKEEELKSIFTHHVKAMDANHEALLSTQRIARARSMLAPFILRRKKDQVLKDLPKKERRVEYCNMTPEQSEFYHKYLNKARDVAVLRAAGKNTGSETTNVLMKLRQAALHPMLFRGRYKDKDLRKIARACNNDPMWAASNPELILLELDAYSDLEIHQLCDRSDALSQWVLNNGEWLASGKVQKTLELLKKYMSEGHRTLIFSQFVMVLDILGLTLEREGISFFRLDGSTPVPERQDMIDDFCSDDCEAMVFLLSTKAGGAGINLAKANKVIVFDSGFNPQDDIQAENRAHRIGQVNEVEVIRLITRNTVEEQIYSMGLTKLKLDEQVAAGGDELDEKAGEKVEKANAKELEEMFFSKLKDGVGPENSLTTPRETPTISDRGSSGSQEDEHKEAGKEVCAQVDQKRVETREKLPARPRAGRKGSGR